MPPTATVRRAVPALVLAALLLAPRAPRAQAPAPADSLPIERLAARADSLWKAERFDDAFDAYQALVRRDETRAPAVFRLATLLSWRDRLPEAIAAFRRYVRLEPADPEGRVALARALAWASRHDESIATYDSVLAADAGYRDAALGAAQTLAWAGRHAESARRYRAWLAGHPGDREAELGLARALAWGGRLEEAGALYRAIGARAGEGGDVEARKGLARVIGWSGALAASEAEWRAVAASAPADPEAWTGLAQVLRWQGRPAEAEVALRRALAVRRDHADAVALLPWVLADVRPSLEPTVTYTSDSDENRATFARVTAAAPAPWLGRVTATAWHRAASLPGVDARSSGLRLAAAWADRRGVLSARAEAGGARLAATRGAGDEAARTLLSAGGRAMWRVAPRAAVGVSAARAPFDETAPLIERGIATTTVGADGEVALPHRLSLSGEAERATVTGGAAVNHRVAGSAALRWARSRRLSYRLLARAFGYDSTTRDGYFAPERYTLLEGGARLQLGPELGLSGGVDLGLGRQTLRLSGEGPTTRAAQRAGGFFTWRPRPGYEVNGALGWANVAGVGQVGGADYRATVATLGGRLRL